MSMSMLQASIRKTGPLGEKIERLRAERIAAGLLKPEINESKPVALISCDGGQLKEYDAQSDAKPRKPVTRRIVADQIDTKQIGGTKYPTVRLIQRIVCHGYGLELSEMLSAQRTLTIALPRQIAMYLAKKMTLHSLPEIGNRFGGKDHTTVLHAVRKIERIAAIDPEMEAEISELREEIMRGVAIAAKTAGDGE